MKALHPSDHEIKATRVPNGCDNTVAIAIDQVFDVPAGTTAATRFLLTPNAQEPLIVEQNNAGVWSYVGNFTPPVFSGKGYSTGMFTAADENAMMSEFRTSFEALRITSESVTIDLIAPALSNQGSVAAAQYPSYPQKFYTVSLKASGLPNGNFADGAGVYYTGDMPMHVYEPVPEKTTILSGTRAMTAAATTGCYMPLRLTDFKMRSLADLACRGRNYVAPAGQPYWYTPIATGNSSLNMTSIGGIGTAEGTFVLADQGHTAGIVYFDAYANNVNFRVRFRMTIEARARPGTRYAPLAEPPPNPDDLALRMYIEIAGRMKNAYPSSYNDFDGLKKTIAAMGRAVLSVSDPIINWAAKGLPLGGAVSAIGTSLTDGLRKWLGAPGTKVESAAQDLRQHSAKEFAKAINDAMKSELTGTAIANAVKKASQQVTQSGRKKRKSRRKPRSAKMQRTVMRTKNGRDVPVFVVRSQSR